MGNVGILRALVASAKQNDKLFAPLQEIHPVARSIVDAKFVNAALQGLAVTKIPVCLAFETNHDPCPRPPVPQGAEPIREVGRLRQLKGVSFIGDICSRVNGLSQGHLLRENAWPIALLRSGLTFDHFGGRRHHGGACSHFPHFVF